MAGESPTSAPKGYFFFFINHPIFSFLFLNMINFLSFVLVVVHLRATGDVPILKQSKFKVFLSHFPI
jgi:hypothetical protein